MDRQSPEQLERTINALLKSLPDRKAPSSLVPRVLARIEERTTKPWWRMSWDCWPQWGRAVLLAACLMAALGVSLAGRAMERLWSTGALAVLSGWCGHAVAFAGRETEFLLGFATHAPVWLYAAAVAVVCAYLMLAGLGVLGYRAIWQPLGERNFVS